MIQKRRFRAVTVLFLSVIIAVLVIGCMEISFASGNANIVEAEDSTNKLTGIDLPPIPIGGDTEIAGDANADGKLTMTDAELAKKAAMKDDGIVLTEAGKKNADLDHNGIITINEARQIKRKVLKCEE